MRVLPLLALQSLRITAGAIRIFSIQTDLSTQAGMVIRYMQPRNGAEPKYIDTGITHIQNTGDDGTILSGQRAEPLQEAAEKYIPGAKEGNLPEKIYVETNGLNEIVRIEPLDLRMGQEYYTALEGNIGRVYEQIRDGKAFQDITKDADADLAVTEEAIIEGSKTEVNNPQFSSWVASEKTAASVKYTQKIKWGIQDIDVRPEGKGYFGTRIKQNDPQIDAYELKINPNNESYYLKHPDGSYVQFENMVNDVVKEGKLIIKQRSFYHVEDMPRFSENRVLIEAIRQEGAAKGAGYIVEWLVSDQKAVLQLTNMFKKYNIDIAVRYLPE